MPNNKSWWKTIGAKLGFALLLILGIEVIGSALNHSMVTELFGRLKWLRESVRGARINFEILYLLHRRIGDSTEEQLVHAEAIRKLADDHSQRLVQLQQGHEATGIPAPTAPSVVANIEKRAERWEKEIKPALLRILSIPVEQSSKQLDECSKLMELQAEDSKAGNDMAMSDAADLTEFIVRMQVWLGFVYVAIIAVIAWVIWSVVTRVRSLSQTAIRIAGGDLKQSANVRGSDEVAGLADAFNVMTGNLRARIASEQDGRQRLERLIEAVKETTNRLAAAGAEILAAVTEQASGAQESLAAVSETVATVDEVAKTAEQAAQRAKSVAESSRRFEELGKTGRNAVSDTISVMTGVKERVESIAEGILGLAEQAQSIGEIIAAVNDISEQTNLVALNAAIEASRAGEQGRAFSVVAGEIRALAEQAKRATAQVRDILGQIQKGTNSAVLATEEGTKSVNRAMKIATEVGETVRNLSDSLLEAAQTAAQIAASAGQQATGMTQINQAMTNINQATTQHTAATAQVERAAQDLHALAQELKQLLGRSAA